MLLPLRDQNPTRTVPFVNYLLIAANVVGYVLQTGLVQRQGESAVVAGYGLVATRVLNDPPGEAFTVLTSMFMHGDLMHIGTNLLYLYIFGDNVEDLLGHFRYLAFYLLSGLAAAAAQILVNVQSPVPMVGASGAIAGVLGAYLMLHPRAPITSLILFFPLWFVFGPFLSAPAWMVVGLWFLLNLVSGVESLGLRGQGGVAFFAHIGGFLAGLLLIKPLLIGRRLAAPREVQWQGWRAPPRPARSRYEVWRDGR